MTTPELAVTLADAERYFSRRLYAARWNEADSADKTKALLWAAALVSGACVFASSAYSTDANDAASVVWNARVVAGVCEEALWLLSRDPTEFPAALARGIAEAEAGSAKVKFDASFVAPLICAATKTLVGELGTFLDSEDAGVVSTPFAL